MAMGGKTERYTIKEKYKKWDKDKDKEPKKKYWRCKGSGITCPHSASYIIKNKNSTLGSSHYMGGNKMKKYFGEKSVITQKSNQKIIQMKKKTFRKVEWDKTICSSSENNPINKVIKPNSENRQIKTYSKYLKIGNSGGGSSRVKAVMKPSSMNRQDNHSTNSQSSLMKLRRGSAMTTYSNNSSRYESIENIKRKNISSNDSVKILSSVKKSKNKEEKTSLWSKLSDRSKKNISYNSSYSKSSLKENSKTKASQKGIQRKSKISIISKGNSSALLVNSNSRLLQKENNIKSTASIGSQSSTGSSTLSTIQGLKEINKVIISKNINDRKELLSHWDNKVYSYKLDQLISIIKSSQTNTGKKISKKKTGNFKNSMSNYGKKSCRKILKTNRKITKKIISKSSVTSKLIFKIIN